MEKNQSESLEVLFDLPFVVTNQKLDSFMSSAIIKWVDNTIRGGPISQSLVAVTGGLQRSTLKRRRSFSVSSRKNMFENQ